MSGAFDLDLVVDCVKTLVDSNRCMICDKLEGSRWKYQCGHTVCGKCVEGANECLLCLSPPNPSGPNLPALDDIATKRATNVSKLLNACEDSFGVNVSRRHRLYEQLKIEKELFPKCIQAPVTYSNRRKSIAHFKENNRPFFPGEQTTHNRGFKMENSFDYVQNWLNESVEKKQKGSHRQPFADISVNQCNTRSTNKKELTSHVKNRADIMLEKVLEKAKNKSISKKHTHFKTAKSVVNSQSLLDKYWSPMKNQGAKMQSNGKQKKDEKNESGIEIDVEPIVIDDSQSQTVDKDKQAWLAVREAEKIDPWILTPDVSLAETFKYTSDLVDKPNADLHKVHTRNSTAVPFYKKSPLKETCNLCRHVETDKTVNTAAQTKDVNITIETNSFITTINMTTVDNKPKLRSKQNTAVQTEIRELCDMEKETNVVIEMNKPVLASQDIFTVERNSEEQANVDERDKVDERSAREAKQITVADSDSDDANESSVSIIQVSAEVHRSSDQMEYGVLSELGETEILSKARHLKRGYSPNSSDSSDKENCDPNKQKKWRLDKKSIDKKQIKKPRF